MELLGGGERGEAEARFGGVLEVRAGVREEDEGHFEKFPPFFPLFGGGGGESSWAAAGWVEEREVVMLAVLMDSMAGVWKRWCG